ncbi:MAG: hypothetical protein OXT67_13165 [Zetaproteobacteria bacterium]|nr:hypothetical protein [Zetaproteobacteria bacterium]
MKCSSLAVMMTFVMGLTAPGYAHMGSVRRFFFSSNSAPQEAQVWPVEQSDGLAHGARFNIVGYFEPLFAFDSEQNRLLTLQALDNAYYHEVEEITSQCRNSMEEMKPRRILFSRRAEYEQAKSKLERDLIIASDDRRRQMSAFAVFYEELQDVLTRRPILQLRRRYQWTVARHDEISSFFQDKWFKVSGEPMPPKWGLEYNSDRVKKACDTFLRHGAALESLRFEIIAVLTERVRERQILNQEYDGISGTFQKWMDFIHKKGVYSS